VLTLREKITEAAFWHEAICLKCGCSDEFPAFVEATCDCEEGKELIVDAAEFQVVLEKLDAEALDG
jgi:hypothetical protein